MSVGTVNMLKLRVPGNLEIDWGSAGDGLEIGWVSLGDRLAAYPANQLIAHFIRLLFRFRLRFRFQCRFLSAL